MDISRQNWNKLAWRNSKIHNIFKYVLSKDDLWFSVLIIHMLNKCFSLGENNGKPSNLFLNGAGARCQ